MPKLGCVTFGRKLIETQDLDPVYSLVANCDVLTAEHLLGRPLLYRWLLAYWCFYHMGTASWICSVSNERDYWARFYKAARTPRVPRCTERRHFRGKKCVRSVRNFHELGIDRLFDPLLKATTCSEVMKATGKWYLFGPWIGFKIADMLETLGLAPIAFSLDDIYLFDSPLEGARRLRESREAEVEDDDLPAWAVETILRELGPMRAPPTFNRNIGPQEAETVLCKWKSYTNNSYHLGEDIESCRKCLTYRPNHLSQSLLQAGVKARLWKSSPEECSTVTPL